MVTAKNLEYKAEKSLPICASNETYLEEMRKLVQQRLTLGDQEGALVEVMRRNQEEQLLKKKSLNIVDEMQLGLISLERSYAVIRELVGKVFDHSFSAGRRTTPGDVEEDIQFK